MKIHLLRLHHRHGPTIGVLFVDSLFVCYTLEDEPQPKKIPGQTRIPAGEYKIELRRAGGMHHDYRRAYPFHDGMLWFRAVPNFEWVYFHVGNHPDDTEGCPLVGLQAGEAAVYHSRPAYERLYKRVLPAAQAGELWADVRDEWELGVKRLDLRS